MLKSIETRFKKPKEASLFFQVEKKDFISLCLKIHSLYLKIK